MIPRAPSLHRLSRHRPAAFLAGVVLCALAGLWLMRPAPPPAGGDYSLIPVHWTPPAMTELAALRDDLLPGTPRALPRPDVVRLAPPAPAALRPPAPATDALAPAEPRPAATAERARPEPVETDPVETEPAPRVVMARPEVTPPLRAASLPAPAAPPPDAAPPAALAEASVPSDPGMSRSPLPPPRPAAVARLASLTLPPITAPAITAPAPAPVAIPLPAAPGPLAAQDRCEAIMARAIPRRPGSAPGGHAVLASLTDLRGTPRDSAIEAQIAAGNIPAFLRQLVPVTVTEGGNRLTFCVMPDYLAVGSDGDFVRTPLGLPAAMRLADRFDMLLPTARMVDQIHAQARLRLTPQPMTPGPQMESTDYLLRHNATLERQRGAAPLGLLVSGHKKDLVLTNRMQTAPGRVAIYGWHQANGRPIQPLSTVHGAGYADYSHGVRLVARTAWLNGRAVDLREILSDSRLAGMVSGEGPIAQALVLAALR